jgi:hypothetical protein
MLSYKFGVQPSFHLWDFELLEYWLCLSDATSIFRKEAKIQIETSAIAQASNLGLYLTRLIF